MKRFITPPNSQSLCHDVISEVQHKKQYSDATLNVRLQPKRILSETQRCPELVKTKEIEELLQLGQKLEQERRRVNQARYRKKQNDRVLTLEKETKQLQQQIEKLIERKRVKTSSIHPKGDIWNVAVEYFRLFGKPSVASKDFLISTMTFDVEFNSEYGVESILRNWSCLSWWFKDLEVELEAVTKTSPETLVASTTTSFTITKGTLSRVFSNLVNNSALTSKLLGQRR
ncbi:hypothetical protein DVH05_028361 [Phytophthora capsici]|nr:hypothetical protein DVH05_028361 [Phytophthora capsici]